MEKRITGFPVIDDDWKLVRFPFHHVIPFPCHIVSNHVYQCLACMLLFLELFYEKKGQRLQLES